MACLPAVHPAAWGEVQRMKREEFIATVKIRGLATADTAREYAQGRTDFDDTDLEDVYRKQSVYDREHEPSRWGTYQGVRSTKRLKQSERYGDIEMTNEDIS